MRNFRTLEIWKRSFKLSLDVYDLTDQYPKEERFALTSQTTRSAVSIPSNISEGCGRSSDKDLARFIDNSLGSAFELETQLLIGQARGYDKTNVIDSILDELNQIQRMVNKYLQTLRPKN